jgi:hypothetical protein
MTPAQRKRCQSRRCHRAVFSWHCDRAGERFVVVGLRVLHGDQAAAPPLRELVDTFVGAVGRGVMKDLILDRGFIDGPQLGRLKTEHGIDTVIPIRKDIDRHLLRGLLRRRPRERLAPGRDEAPHDGARRPGLPPGQDPPPADRHPAVLPSVPEIPAAPPPPPKIGPLTSEWQERLGNDCIPVAGR